MNTWISATIRQYFAKTNRYELYYASPPYNLYKKSAAAERIQLRGVPPNTSFPESSVVPPQQAASALGPTAKVHPPPGLGQTLGSPPIRETSSSNVYSTLAPGETRSVMGTRPPPHVPLAQVNDYAKQTQRAFAASRTVGAPRVSTGEPCDGPALDRPVAPNRAANPQEKELPIKAPPPLPPSREEARTEH